MNDGLMCRKSTTLTLLALAITTLSAIGPHAVLASAGGDRPRVVVMPFQVETQDQEHLGYVVSMAIKQDINSIQDIILVDLGQLGRVMGDRKWEPTAYAKAGGATEMLGFTHADVLVGGKLSRKDSTWTVESTLYWNSATKAPESWSVTGADLWKLSDEILAKLVEKLGIRLQDDAAKNVQAQPKAGLKAAEELAKAEIACSQGRARQGIGACKNAVELAPEWSAAHALLGGIYLAIEEADLAVSSFREALRLDPSNMCRSNLAVAYRRKGDNAQAIKEYQETIKAYPNYPAIHVQLAVAHSYSKDNDSAIKEFKEALRLDPYVPDARYMLGITYRQMQRLDDAAAEFQQAIKDYPADAQAFVMLAVIHQLKGDLDRAISTLKDGITANPRYGKLHNNLAAIYVAQKDYDQAWKHVHAAQDLGFDVAAVILQQLRANSTEPAR